MKDQKRRKRYIEVKGSRQGVVDGGRCKKKCTKMSGEKDRRKEGRTKRDEEEKEE